MQRPLAPVVVGRLFMSTALTLLLPLIAEWSRRGSRSGSGTARRAATLATRSRPSSGDAMCLAIALRRAAGLTAIAVLLGGCGVLAEISEGRREYVAGWRNGKVLEVGSAGALPTQPPWARDCRASEPAASPKQAYALVQYNTHHSRRSRIVPVPNGMLVTVGDLVRVNVKRCDGAIRPRDER